MDSRVNKEALSDLVKNIHGGFTVNYRGHSIDTISSITQSKLIKKRAGFSSSSYGITVATINKPIIANSSIEVVDMNGNRPIYVKDIEHEEIKYDFDSVPYLLEEMRIAPEVLLKRGGRWYIDKYMVSMCEQYHFGFINKRNEMVFNEDFILFVEMSML